MRWAQGIEDDHVRIGELLDRLQALAAAPASSLPAPRWHRLWRTELGELGELLERHFEREEQGGYMAEVLVRRPAWTERIDRLGAEHSDLAAGLRAILDSAEETHPPRGLRGWIEAMHAHEHAETEILQAAWYNDRGGGD